MTLSHRWGPGYAMKLTTNNYTQLCRGVNVEMLPPLYQDAIVVMDKLGVEYLWIDSLCIIQEGDEGADWQREVSRMERVYAGSFCNIAADNVLGTLAYFRG
ncbi:hypothetical protein GGR57DRAFT_453282 [Xylariaceae sp. FL1272]|nr:hypothetical protein GGR57DRAFT_453282 [Xylariaceae sp. FL1272]